MKAILINSSLQKVTTIELNPKEVLQSTYKAIGNDCNIVEGVLAIRNRDLLVVDEEGLFKEGLCAFFFQDQFFYGNGVIWGGDEKGKTIDCEITDSKVIDMVKFVDKSKTAVIRSMILSGNNFIHDLQK